MYYKSFPINIKNISSSHGSSKQSFRERLKENWLIIFFFGSIKARDNRVLECRLQNALQNIELFSKEYLALHMWLLKLEKSVKKYHKIKVKEILEQEGGIKNFKIGPYTPKCGRSKWSFLQEILLFEILLSYYKKCC